MKMYDFARPSRQHLLGYLLVAPAVLMVGLIIMYPLFISIDLSFQDVKLPRIGENRKPFTFKNYEKLFASSDPPGIQNPTCTGRAKRDSSGNKWCVEERLRDRKGEQSLRTYNREQQRERIYHPDS